MQDCSSITIKDIATILVGIGTTILATTNLFLTLLRGPSISVQLGRVIRIGRRSSSTYTILADTIMFNSGAEPALVIDLELLLANVGGGLEHTAGWQEFRETAAVEILEDGMRYIQKGTRSKFAGFATAVVVPKSDAIVKEVAYRSPGSSDILPGRYKISVRGTLLRRRGKVFNRRIKFESFGRFIDLSEDLLSHMSKLNPHGSKVETNVRFQLNHETYIAQSDYLSLVAL